MNKDYIYKRRLLALAKFLDKLPSERFNYESWVGDDWKGKENLSCGTTACAFGWAATMPSLRKAGLRLKYNERGGYGYVTMKGYHGHAVKAPSCAAWKVFGLSFLEYEFLFIPHSKTYVNGDYLEGPNYDATAKEVANHIRQFVKRKYKRAKAQ